MSLFTTLAVIDSLSSNSGYEARDPEAEKKHRDAVDNYKKLRGEFKDRWKKEGGRGGQTMREAFMDFLDDHYEQRFKSCRLHSPARQYLELNELKNELDSVENHTSNRMLMALGGMCIAIAMVIGSFLPVAALGTAANAFLGLGSFATSVVGGYGLAKKFTPLLRGAADLAHNFQKSLEGPISDLENNTPPSELMKPERGGPDRSEDFYVQKMLNSAPPAMRERLFSSFAKSAARQARGEPDAPAVTQKITL